MKHASETKNTKRFDIFTTFVVIVGILISFVNIYKFAQKSQAANAVWAGIALLALSFVLATQLAAMRRRNR